MCAFGVGLPLVELSDGIAVAIDATAWALIQASAGYLAHRLPRQRLDHDTWLTRQRGFERGGLIYERFAIRRWKDALPEAGAMFAGGVSKRHLSRSVDGLAAFAVETRRAELAHWFPLAMSPVFALWNRPLVAALMVVYGVGINVPFIAVQRYNRARVARSLARRTSASSSDVRLESAAARLRSDRPTKGNNMPNGSPP